MLENMIFFYFVRRTSKISDGPLKLCPIQSKTAYKLLAVQYIGYSDRFHVRVMKTDNLNCWEFSPRRMSVLKSISRETQFFQIIEIGFPMHFSNEYLASRPLNSIKRIFQQILDKRMG